MFRMRSVWFLTLISEKKVDETGAVKVHGLDGNKEHVWDGSGAREE